MGGDCLQEELEIGSYDRFKNLKAPILKKVDAFFGMPFLPAIRDRSPG
jgi:hypothetical protein